jgi:hypothetical protein
MKTIKEHRIEFIVPFVFAMEGQENPRQRLRANVVEFVLLLLLLGQKKDRVVAVVGLIYNGHGEHI